ncbi:MAG: hypothetical protein IJK31_02555 [Ruminococcus sp.]|nr:hypothetical protein [Ruminococcus sp.]
MKRMSDDSAAQRLRYGQGPLTALIIAVCSIFMQWFLWFVYEKAGYSWGFNLVTPLIICMMYHCVQLDAGRQGNFSRRFCFFWGVIVPLAAGLAMTLFLFLRYPDMSPFSPEADYTGKPREVIAIYSGRIVMTSIYLLIFAVIDIPILKRTDNKTNE